MTRNYVASRQLAAMRVVAVAVEEELPHRGELAAERRGRPCLDRTAPDTEARLCC